MRRFLVLLLVMLLAACKGGKVEHNYAVHTEGDAQAGRAVIREVGCGSCHTIPGVRGANGVVGPPLDSFARRTYIAGRIPNTPENLSLWIYSPQSVDPQTAMPDLGLDQRQVADVVAYLYTLE